MVSLSPETIQVGAGALGVLLLQLLGRQAWRLWHRAHAHFAKTDRTPPAPHDAAAYFHTMLAPADGGRDEVLYQGRSAIEAKRHFYRNDVKGTITFLDGPVARGTRVVA